MEWSQLGQVILSFACVIGLMLLLSYLLRRFGLEKKWQSFRSSHGLISVVDTMFLDPKRRVVMIGVEQKRYLILMDQDRAQLIDTLDAAAKEAS